MIKGYRNKGTEDIAHGHNTKAARKLLPPEQHRSAAIKLKLLDGAREPSDLINIIGLRYHELAPNRAGEFSISINKQYRITFEWEQADVNNVNIEDYHDDRKGKK